MWNALLVRTLVVSLVVLVIGATASAQECGRRPDDDLDFPPPETPPDGEPHYRELTDALQTDALRLGLLVQVLAVLGYVLTPPTSLRIGANLRVLVSTLDLDRTRLLVNLQLAF